jgi:hypothetical protein
MTSPLWHLSQGELSEFSQNIRPKGLYHDAESDFFDGSPVSIPAGNDAARKVGYLGDMVEVELTVNAMVSKVDSLSKSEGSGEFWSHDGTIIPW